MLDALIRWSLANRSIVLALAVALFVLGGAQAGSLPVDVLPDLNRPTVTIMAEAPGLAPEEVESLVTRPIEQLLMGALGARRVRSQSAPGLSITWVEFEWGSDVHRDRVVVQEKLQLAEERLPEGVNPVLGPVSSIMGEIALLALTSETASRLDVRAAADGLVRPRLLAIPGVAQVTVIGGGPKQYQVLTSPARLAAHQITLAELARAVAAANVDAGGGVVVSSDRERFIRLSGRISSLEELEESVVAWRSPTPVLVKHVADVRAGTPVPRGDASLDGTPAVILSIQKQPGADTLTLQRALDRALDELEPRLPAGVRFEREVYKQSEFIEPAVDNVEVAVRDGAILVLFVLLVFLGSVRASLVTVVAIPTSLVATAVVFRAFGSSVNTMTLGGLAVAIGELVDDSIVDVENVLRRLRQERGRPALEVVYEASSQVRGSIVYATFIVTLAVLPLYALGGIEGRIFAPLATSYLVSLLASLVVSLTVTPALASLVLPGAREVERTEPRVVRALKAWDERLVRATLRRPDRVLLASVFLVALAAILAIGIGGEFLPPFEEASLSVVLSGEPGTSLEESNRIGTLAERLLHEIPEVERTARRTGRAELDEHAEGVHVSELDVRLRAGRPRAVVEDDVRDKLAALAGVHVDVGAPIEHRLDHILSGVRAEVAVKAFGPDLDVLRSVAHEVRDALAKVPGVVDLVVEPQVEVPHVLVRVKRREAARYGLKAEEVTRTLEIALRGLKVSQVLEEGRAFDLVTWYDETARNDVNAIRSTWLDTPSGARVTLGEVAEVVETTGPSTILRENAQRRVAVTCNVRGDDPAAIVEDIRGALERDVSPGLPPEVSLELGGQVEAQRAAARRLFLLSLASGAGILVLLVRALGSWRAAIQCLANVPLAAVGAVLALRIAGGTFSLASLVGFVTLTGIVVRNGILMLSHYAELAEETGASLEDVVVKGTLERLVPVLMTALTAVMGLVPLALAKDEPGTELLRPLAIVVIGGLVSSTLLDQLVTPALYFRFSGRRRRAPKLELAPAHESPS